MSVPQSPQPAKLVVGLFMNERSLLGPAARDLSAAFGPVDLAGPWFAFDFTDYYRSETGAPLYRRMLAFKELVEQHDLAQIKLATNEFEQRYVQAERRRINIDPGYLVRERFVLASGKNFTHRISVGRGVYADLTLIYAQGRFRTLPWTYPDYAAENMLAFLERVRKKYVWDIESRKGPRVQGSKGSRREKGSSETAHEDEKI